MQYIFTYNKAMGLEWKQYAYRIPFPTCDFKEVMNNISRS